ncbi:MAG: hypothetical protein GY940_15415 [bacterium]|nr:hypothetical protein [bacterium]
MSDGDGFLDYFIGAPKKKALDDARDTALLRKPDKSKEDAANKECNKIPIDWRELKPLLEKLSRSRQLRYELTTYEYENGKLSLFNSDFLLRNKNAEHSITQFTLDYLMKHGVDDETIALLRPLKDKIFYGAAGGLDVLEEVEALFGPQRIEEFRALRPILLRSITISSEMVEWRYHAPTKPTPGYDHPSVIREMEKTKEESKSEAKMNEFCQDVKNHLRLLTEVFPLLATCDEKFRKLWEEKFPQLEPTITKMEKWVDGWCLNHPRTHAWIYNPVTFTLTQRLLEQIRDAEKVEGHRQIAEKLAPLKDVPIEDEEGFIRRVRDILGEDATKRVIWMVLRNTRKSGGQHPVNPPETHSVALDYFHDNPAKFMECLQFMMICPIRVHFQYNQPETLEQLEGVVSEPVEIERVVKQINHVHRYADGAVRLSLHGFTDRSGNKAHNEELSERRARWLLDRLRERIRPLPFNSIETEGFGEEKATSPDDRSPDDRYVKVIMRSLK